MENNNLNDFLNGNKLSIEKVNDLLPCQIVTQKNTENKATNNQIKLALSPREFEITLLITKGLKNKEIAEQLNLAYETIKTHRKSIFKKLNINHVSQLIHLNL